MSLSLLSRNTQQWKIGPTTRKVQAEYVNGILVIFKSQHTSHVLLCMTTFGLNLVVQRLGRSVSNNFGWNTAGISGNSENLIPKELKRRPDGKKRDLSLRLEATFVILRLQ